jgi:hypothetical protein
MWIVDWEYSGMNDPMWDLGDLSVEGGFGPDQDEEMLPPISADRPARDRARMVIYKAMCDLLWTLWGLIQLANGNPADDFRTYADTRFARCKALMATRGLRAPGGGSPLPRPAPHPEHLEQRGRHGIGGRRRLTNADCLVVVADARLADGAGPAARDLRRRPA